MKRFRATLLAICLILGWLGYSELSLYFRNTTPQQISIHELETQGAQREWLQVSGGYQDLLQAINMSGTMEIDAFLVPLKTSKDSPQVKVWFETRDPQIVEALKTYYFKLDSDLQRQTFFEKNREIFYAQRDLLGMTADSPIAASNRSKLLELLGEMQIPVEADVIFISEGKEPAKYRGFFFAGMALLGFVKLLSGLKTKKQNQAPESLPEEP